MVRFLHCYLCVMGWKYRKSLSIHWGKAVYKQPLLDPVVVGPCALGCLFYFSSALLSSPFLLLFLVVFAFSTFMIVLGFIFALCKSTLYMKSKCSLLEFVDDFVLALLSSCFLCFLQDTSFRYSDLKKLKILDM